MCPNKGPKKKSSKPIKTVAQDDPGQADPDLGKTCCVPSGQVNCPNPSETNLTMSSTTRVICSNSKCTQSGLVHNKCFEKFESFLVVFIGKYGRCRDWSEKQKYNSLWADRGKYACYDLVVKLCGCKCGHGYIKRDLEAHPEEEAPRAEMEKEKRKRTKTEIKPKLNIRKDMVSQKGVGSFSSSKPVLLKRSKNKVHDEYEETPPINKTIPGLHSSVPLTLNMYLPETKPKEQKPKQKIKPVMKPEIMNDISEGWIKVSKSSFHGKAYQTFSLGMDNRDILEVYQSEEDEESNDDVFEKSDQLSETSVDERQIKEAHSVASTAEFSSLDSNFTISKDTLSDAQLEELLGNLVEEKLVEEIAKNKALAEIGRLIGENFAQCEAFQEERRKLLKEIETVSQANMELREAAEAREAVLQEQINAQEKNFHSVVAERAELLEENESLRRLVRVLELDKEKVRTETEDMVSKTVEAVKVSEKATIKLLENETIRIMGYVGSLKDKLVALECSVDRLKGSEKLNDGENSTDSCLSLTSDNSIKREDIVKIAKEEAEKVNSKVELMENTVKNLEMNQTYLEKKLLSYPGVVPGSEISGNMKDKILDLVHSCESFEEMLGRMSAAQDKAFQQMEALDKDVCLLAVKNEVFRGELDKYGAKLTALEAEEF